MKSSDIIKTNVCDIGGVDLRSAVDRAKKSGDWVPVDAEGWSDAAEGLQIAADAAAEIGDYGRGRGRPGSLGCEACGFVPGDPFVSSLFQADAGEEHLVRLGKLGGRAAAEVGLFEQQMGLGGRKAAAKAGSGCVKWRLIVGKLGEDCPGLGSGEPFVISKVATSCHLSKAAERIFVEGRRGYGEISVMASRPLIIATLLGASVGVPYLTSKSQSGKPAATPAPTAAGSASFGSPSAATTMPLQTPFAAPPLAPAPTPATTQLVGATNGQGTPIIAAPAVVNRPAINGTQFTSIDQVIRFDVTKEWVYQNWDRKSTGPTDVGLFGVRVPLAMSPQMWALAGSLTYYFNTQGQVEHISFKGRTGDATQLVQLLMSRYQFQPAQSLAGEQVYQAQYNGQVQSELRTHPESVMWLNTANQSVAVELELARPGSIRVLPPRPTGFEELAATQAQQQSQQAAAAQAEATEKSAAAAKSSGDSYFNKIRFATPEEQSQVIWQRWPK